MISLLYFAGAVLLVYVIYHVYKKMQTKKEPSLYDRLGGIFPISAVVNEFSDRLLKNPVVGVDSKNPQLREWSRNKAATRLQGLKFMRTLWLADVSGGPFKFQNSANSKCPFFSSSCRLNLEKAHCPFKITSNEFDAVAKELNETMISFSVPQKERNEVLAAFAAHKQEVIACSF